MAGISAGSLFNETYYLQQNPDVAAAVRAGTFASGRAHWNQFGQAEGRTFSPAFSSAEYARQNPDLADAGITSNAALTRHFLVSGLGEGRLFLPAAAFNAAYYAAQNPDLAAAGIDSDTELFRHFLTNGIAENRVATQNFDGAGYLARNPDLAAYLAAGNTFGGYTGAAAARFHYYNNGLAEGRAFPQLAQAFSVVPGSSSVAEGGALTFTVNALLPVATDTTFTYNLTGDTNGGSLSAGAASDFGSVTGTVTIAAGSQTATFTLTPTVDGVVEGLEGFRVALLDSNLGVRAQAVFAVSDSVTPPVLGRSFTLTTGSDALIGDAGNNVFTAPLAGNSDTFTSGDVISGGAGTDQLNITLGGASNFAIAAATTGIEQVYIRSQSTDSNGSSGENNVSGSTGNQITVDAQDMVGVLQWHNVDSRADLVIEDVRILDSQITRDITIRLSNTDPGTIGASAADRNDSHTDFEFYFSPESLRAASPTASNSTVTFEFSDNRGIVGREAASLNVNVQFTLNGVSYNLLNVNSGAANSAPDANGFYSPGTYAQFISNLQARINATPGLNGLTVSDAGLVTSLPVTNAAGQTVQQLTPFGRAISITDPAGKLFSSVTFNAGTQGSTFSIDGRSFLGNPVTDNPLITSSIILDNVGRESEAGDLVIGSMSTRTGVERFEIVVENNSNTSGTSGQGVNPNNPDSAIGTGSTLTPPANARPGSWLQSVSSTNNMLREVVARNDAAGIARPDYLYIGSGTDAAGNNLTVLRDAPTLLNTDGLRDVRLFDASAMAGVVKVGATISAESIRKYQNLVDTANGGSSSSNGSTDNVAFLYSTGSNNDAINLNISGTVAGSRTLTGRSDFTFNVNSGAGNDTIRVSITDDAGNNANWYNNQDINSNVTVDGGAGDDVIWTPGAGDMVIIGGAGNDTIYTDNTGDQSAARAGSQRVTWVLNTRDVAQVAGSNNLEDLRSEVPVSFSAVNAQVQVTFRGIQSAQTSIAGSVGSLTNVTFTDTDINQAIKNAVNTNSVLNKLLVVEDGPAGSLVVRSLIDGQHGVADFSVALSSTALNTTQTAITPALTVFSPVNSTLGTRYDSELGTLGGLVQVGADSTTTSDNTVTGGVGDDVIVLGTTDGALQVPNSTYDESNEVLVYGAGFGNDTVVNFVSGGASGNDAFDFSALGASVTAANFGSLSLGGSVVVALETLANDTAAEVAALFSDSAIAKNHVYIAYNGTNVARVYSIADGAGVGAGNVVATLQGTIDLADTGWATLTAANFSSTLLNSGAVAGGGGGAVGETARAATIAGAGNDNAAGNAVTYTVTPATGVFTISNFAAGDRIDFIDAQLPLVTVLNNSFTDGQITLQYAAAGVVQQITLTGLSNAVDQTIFDVAGVNAAFGAGTIF